MLTLRELTKEGPFFRLTWVDDFDWDDTEHVHLTPAASIERCFNDILMPLAGERGEQLTEAEVLKALTEGAAESLFPKGRIDWLGLALYSEHRFLKAMGKLAEAVTPEHQAEISATHPLMYRLMDLFIHKGAETVGSGVAVQAPESLDPLQPLPSRPAEGTGSDSPDYPR